MTTKATANMKLLSRTRKVLLSVLCLGGVAIAAVGATGNERTSQLTIQEWSRLVWDSASRGDQKRLEAYFDAVPDGPENTRAQGLRAAVDQHNTNLQTALDNRAESLAKARTKMQEFLADGNVSRALTSAVEVQTLSTDQKAVLNDADVDAVVRRAKAEVPNARRQGDWLYAYELLYRLKILYEHTGEYEQELDRVNQRLGLLTHYAPERLHELRVLQAERFDEEPLAEFNPAMTQDWQQRVDGINHRMVKKAIETAAENHIEAGGWRPLLRGALNGMRMVATTPALGETFEGLKDQRKVNAWLDFLDQKQARIIATPDADLGYWYAARLLDKIVGESEETINLPKRVIFREFGDGAMRELDKFSEIIWPNKLRRFKQSTHGSFVGVGILIRHDEKRDILVVNPLEGSPAYFAGIKPGDRIAQVDGASTAGWSLNDAVDRITGREGTEVKLGIRREGIDEPLIYTIQRDVIKIRSIKGWWKERLEKDGEPVWDWFIDPSIRIAYIRLSAFNEDTHGDLKRAWKEIRRHGEPNGLILDLRYNPGGLLTSAVDISNLFVREGVIVSGETKDGSKAWPDRRAEPNKAIIARQGVPTVVLINQGSASASEIVAGCLQAHGAAIIVGRRSYGKGSVQTVHPISRSSALLKLTTQYYRLPPSAEQIARGEKGNLVHKRPGATDWGVNPDVKVNSTPQEIKAAYDLRQAADILAAAGDDHVERPDINGLITDGLDPQLETALLILQARALGMTPRGTRHAMAR
ncbi:MAG: S41 family peptidase [Planctomycetes bacterium]|nr:S41 family peptidase [Planctomycetota bacterium]